MKKIFNLWKVVLFCMTCVLFASITACDSDDPTPTPEPQDPKENGSVEFKVEIPSDNGSGTSGDPVIVDKGEELNMAISQKSSYTDPDGSVFTCEPKATIKLSATSDTIVAKDLTELTKVKDGSDVKTSSSGTSPVRNQTLQTFDIGGQKVVFDLSHEIYRHVNSLNERIEMPYIKVNPANLGNAAATEESPTGRSTVAVSSVTVRPLVKSRAETVTDSTMYEVTVRFNLGIESMNAKADSKQTLEFAVTYVGVVETTTTLNDPVRELTYQWQASGTNSSASPFVRQQGKTMEVVMNQTSSYTDPYGNKYTGSPKVKVTVSASKDTIWTSSIDALKQLSDKTGSVSGQQTATQKFGNDQQEISFVWSYENSEQLPYYALEPVSLKGVETKELGDKTVAGKEASLYEITATFSQKAVAQNFGDKTSEVEIEYVVSFVGAIEITLTNVRYEPFGEWRPSHDNLPLGYYASVRRVRVYSNGKEVSDVFSDLGHPAILFSEVEEETTIYRGNENEYAIKFYPYTLTNVTDSTETCTFKTEVPYMTEIKATTREGSFSLDGLWNVASYIKSKDADHSDLSTKVDNNDFPDDSRANAWYYKGFTLLRTLDVEWDVFRTRVIHFRFSIHDQCLVIDGKCIDFKKLHKFNISYNYDSKDFSEDWGSGKVVTHTHELKYLGKTFVGTQIDTVFVATPKQ